MVDPIFLFFNLSHFILWLYKHMSSFKCNISSVLLIIVYIALKLFADNLMIFTIKSFCCSFTLTGIIWFPSIHLFVFQMIKAAEWTKDCIAVVCILCFMPHKVYPHLLHQMVLEDNIALQSSSLSFTVHYLARKHIFLVVKINLWCVNKDEDV